MDDVSTLASAVAAGDLAGVQRLLELNPTLAAARVGPRTMLHIATDWPGHRAHVVDIIGALVAAGADLDAGFAGPDGEKPLHWAASNDDVEAVDALLELGADIEATGAVIGGGTPMADATAFGQWKAAELLVVRGARLTLWEAAALGRLELVESAFASPNPPDAQEVTSALWGAAHGGHRPTAEFLVSQGAEVRWVGWDDLNPIDAGRRSGHQELADWLEAVAPAPDRDGDGEGSAATAEVIQAAVDEPPLPG